MKTFYRICAGNILKPKAWFYFYNKAEAARFYARHMQIYGKGEEFQISRPIKHKTYNNALALLYEASAERTANEMLL